MGDEYLAEQVKRDANSVTLRLVARDEEQEGEILLTVDNATGKPLAVSYILYDDRIDVEIKSFVSRKEAVKVFLKNDYKGYDIVDFR